MKLTQRLIPRWFTLPAVLIGCIVSTASLLAQTATSTVQGHVYNPSTKAYVSNAEVRLEGTNQVAYTSSDGSFQFNAVPTGPASVSVAFSGYSTVKETFTVTPGQTVVPEINITSSADVAATGSNDTAVKLDTFTVVSAREGQSKAVMSQRRNMNIVTSVSADQFGPVLNGNVGEFLKYLPGVDLDYVESETRGPRLGGMDGQYVGVSIDGLRMANVDANRGGGAQSRATSFEGFSMTSVDSIEVNRTASPENDADSPAGNINMKTKRAFNLKGRRFDYTLGTTLNGDEFTLGTEVHPAEKNSHQFRPNGGFTYAESFFDHKFGVLLSASRSNSITEQTSESITYNTASTVADPRPMVVQQVDFKDSPKWIQKDAILFTADWKVFTRLTLSLNAVYSFYNSDNLSRDVILTGGNNNSNVNNGRSAILGDGVNYSGTSSPTNAVSGLDWGGGSASKRVWTRQLAPHFEYKYGPLTIDGALAYSNAVNMYHALETGKANAVAGGVPASFTATRSDARSWEWTIKQTSGADWFNINNFGPPTNSGSNSQTGGTSINNRTENWEVDKWTGVLNAAYDLPFMKKFPTVIKVGGKIDEEDRTDHNKNSISKWVYVGPGGDTVALNPANGTYSVTSYGNWANAGAQYISPEPFRNYDTNRLNLVNINGVSGVPPFPNQLAITQLYAAHPEQFVNTASVNDYYNSLFGPERRITETVKAAYTQADTRVTSKISIRFGVRMEDTTDVVKDFNPLTPTQMLSSPFASQFTKDPVTGLVTPAMGTTVPALIYQYTTQPKVKRTASYHDYFPSFLVKYDILPNLEWQAGWNKAIARPPIDNLAGVRTINDNANPPTVTIPNTNLKPEHHKALQTRLAYYFGGSSPGQISIAAIQDEATNFISNKTYPNGIPLGITDPIFNGYQFISAQNDPGVHRYRNLDFNYQQTMGFLPSPYLRGLSTGFTYSRSYDNQRHQGLVGRHWGFTPGYTYKRFSASVGVIWDDWKPNSGTYGEYFGAITRIDINNISFKINKNLSIYMAVHNLTNAKDLQYKDAPGVTEGHGGSLRGMEVYGTTYTFGITGTF